jgi:hypothetical protein
MHGRRQSLHGHHLIWDASPSDDAQVDLDADAGRFSVAKQYTLQLRLDCDSAEPCIADGDSVETVLTLGSALDLSGLQSTVHIRTEVESLVSCQRSKAWVERELRTIPLSGTLVVRLRVNDADNLAVKQTRAEVEFRFNGRLLAVQWTKGSNEYMALVPADLTQQAGEYELLVNATTAWNETSRQQVGCELLRYTYTVSSGLIVYCLQSLGGPRPFVRSSYTSQVLHPCRGGPDAADHSGFSRIGDGPHGGSVGFDRS